MTCATDGAQYILTFKKNVHGILLSKSEPHYIENNITNHVASCAPQVVQRRILINLTVSYRWSTSSLYYNSFQ